MPERVQPSFGKPQPFEQQMEDALAQVAVGEGRRVTLSEKLENAGRPGTRQSWSGGPTRTIRALWIEM
jgi:hypothetical protein